MFLVRRFSVVTLASALVAQASFSSIVRAQAAPSDKAGAETLFNQARHLVAAGRIADACEKFAASQRLEPAVGTLLNLGECHERQGKTASAWAEYRDAAGLARGRGESERQAFADRRAAVLKSKLSKLVVQIAYRQLPPAFELRRDGVILDAASVGVPIPVDPGEHVLEASAAGMVPWKSTFTIAPNGSTTVAQVPELTPGPSPDATASFKSPRYPQRTTAIVTGAFGLAAVLVSGGLALDARSSWASVRSNCNNAVCADSASYDTGRAARREANVATAVGIAGVVGVATGVVLFITASPVDAGPAPVGGWTVLPAWAKGNLGVDFSGRF